MDWKYATKEQIDSMNFEAAREIVQRQIQLGHTVDGTWKPRAHLTKALEVVLQYADAYNENINTKR